MEIDDSEFTSAVRILERQDQLAKQKIKTLEETVAAEKKRNEQLKAEVTAKENALKEKESRLKELSIRKKKMIAILTQAKELLEKST